MHPLLMGLAIALAVPVGPAQSQPAPQQKKAPATAPWLGLETRYPTPQEATSLALVKKVRIQGQIITKIAKGGPAGAAGLGVGDVLLKLGENALYSFDDIRDFVATSKPGRKVKARVKRGKPLGEEVVQLTIGKRTMSAEEARQPAFPWQYASLAQLKTALEHAKKEGKRVLVGISGAET